MNARLNSFFNTIDEKGEVLKKSEEQAKSQEELIYSFFSYNFLLIFTPFEVKKYLKLDNVPITSVRRAISNLTRKGLLVKTVQMRKGIYGKLNYCWSWKK